MDSPKSFEYNGNHYVKLHFYHSKKEIPFFAVLPLKLKAKRVVAFLRECGFLDRDETIAELQTVAADMTLGAHISAAGDAFTIGLRNQYATGGTAQRKKTLSHPAPKDGVRHCVVHFSHSVSWQQGGMLVPEELTTYDLGELMRINRLISDFEDIEVLCDHSPSRLQDLHDNPFGAEVTGFESDEDFIYAFPSRLADLRDKCFGGKAIRFIIVDSSLPDPSDDLYFVDEVIFDE